MTIVSRPRLSNNAGATGRRRAVGAVDRERESGRARRRSGARRAGDRGTRPTRSALRDRRRLRLPRAVHDESATIASTSRSTRSVNFSPRPEKTLMPLSSNGLCDAEITTPAS